VATHDGDVQRWEHRRRLAADGLPAPAAAHAPTVTPPPARDALARLSDVPSAHEIVTFNDAPPPPGASPWVTSHGPMTELQVVAADPSWPDTYRLLTAMITDALGDVAVAVEHVGSTSVPGLPAKPVIDIDLTVRDSRDEGSYVPALERCGFVLVVREPWWYEHRCLRHEEPACNLHVFSPDCAETERHRIFRDWLRSHPEDCSLYAATKTAAAAETRATGGHTMDYNARKELVVREIYSRAFHDRGLTP
jgi:GrpB-like predicted nucleotidyltransferase (UPF0157 family)